MQLAPDNAFKALADPTRRRLFERLAREGELSVNALTEGSGVSQPAVSKHLAVLKRAQLVDERRQGRESRYRVDQQGLGPVVDWFSHYAAFWPDKLDRLEDLLNRIDQ